MTGQKHVSIYIFQIWLQTLTRQVLFVKLCEYQIQGLADDKPNYNESCETNIFFINRVPVGSDWLVAGRTL